MLRRTGVLATLLAGLGLLGASLHGMTRVDRTLQVAVTPAAPQFVDDHHDRCHRREHRPGV